MDVLCCVDAAAGNSLNNNVLKRGMNMYQLMFSRLMSNAVRLAAVLLFVAVGTVQATSIPYSPSEFGRYFNYDKSLQDNGSVQKVVKLLAAGRRDEAKIQLARILTVNPKNAQALGLAGMFLLEEKKYPAAESSFRRALKIHPDNPALMSKLGVSLLLQKKLNDGETALRKALSVDKSDALALRYMGWISQVRGDVFAAAGYYKRFLNAGDNDKSRPGRMQDQVAQLFNKVGWYQDTVNLLGKSLDKKPDTMLKQSMAVSLIEAYIELNQLRKASRWIDRLEGQKLAHEIELAILKGRLLRQRKEFFKAIRVLRKAADEDDRYKARIQHLIAQTYIMAGDKKSALKELEDLSTRAEKADFIQIVGDIVRLKLGLNDTRGALEFMQQAVARKPGIPVLQYQLSDLQLLLKQPRKALATSDALIKKFPRYAEGYYQSGRIERGYKNYDRAIKLLKKATLLYSGLEQAWLEYAGVYLDKGKGEVAIEILKKAIQENPGKAGMIFELAAVYQELGQLQKANRQYYAALEVQPNHWVALHNLVLNLLESPKQYREALAVSKKAYAANSDNPRIADVYGWALFKTGKVKASLPLLRKSVKALPGEGYINYHLGAALLKAGKPADGRRYLKKALSAGVDKTDKAAILALIK